MNIQELFKRITKLSPVFDACMKEHLEDNGNKLLPHLLMADFGRLITSFFDLEGQTHPFTLSELEEVLKILEEGMRLGDEETQNVLAVSWIECLWLEPYFAKLEPLLGPTILLEIKKQKG